MRVVPRVVLLLLAALGMTAYTGHAQGARWIEYRGSIGYGEWISAELAPETVAHVWEFAGRAGDEVFIAMNELDGGLDPYLLLLQMSDVDLEEFFALSDEELNDLYAVAENRGLLLADNNDWDGYNALIPSFVLPADGRYFIVAASCCTGGSWGPYDLGLGVLSEQPPTSRLSSPELYGISPQSGRAGSILRLTLEGEGFSGIGWLSGVVIGGVEMQVLSWNIISDQVIEIAILIPEDTPTGDSEISFYFENFDFHAYFFVEPLEIEPTEPSNIEPMEPQNIAPTEPPITTYNDPTEPSSPPPIFPALILVIGPILLLGIAGLVVWRLTQPGKPAKSPKRAPPKTAQPPPNVRFVAEKDPGTQAIEPANKSIKFATDLYFKLELDRGVQQIQLKGNRLVGDRK